MTGICAWLDDPTVLARMELAEAEREERSRRRAAATVRTAERNAALADGLEVILGDVLRQEMANDAEANAALADDCAWFVE
jgi:hypothetical protein